jgi:streptomycin 6-kinase
VIDRAVEFTHEREANFDIHTAVLVNGDAHLHNVLEAADGGFRMVDPEGLISEPAHDLGIPLRAYCDELLAGNCRELAVRWCGILADRTGVDPEAIWQWAFIERVSTGLYMSHLRYDVPGFFRTAELLVDAKWT